ncbi:hypothetical protein CS542_09160 [Pedobacter sp. IW39]|nr:hypothetical protein CS542_09160 [Pedobacter sp. IW39]
MLLSQHSAFCAKTSGNCEYTDTRGLGLLLYRYTGRPDLVGGYSIRPSEDLPGVERAVGCILMLCHIR